MNKIYNKIIIKQLKSAIKCSKKQKLILHSLGLKKINYQVKHISSPQILGMIYKIKHLLEVKEI